jgi:hypothetical protein
MEMLSRLSNDDLTDLPPESLQPILEALPACIRGDADRPPEFWERQRAAILSRISAADIQAGSGVPGVAWAIAVAILVIASFMLSSGPRVAPAPQAQTDPDRELLLEVEAAMQSGGPEALEPAALLADEISQYEKTSSVVPSRKEVNDEE